MQMQYTTVCCVDPTKTVRLKNTFWMSKPLNHLDPASMPPHKAEKTNSNSKYVLIIHQTVTDVIVGNSSVLVVGAL